MLQLCEAPNNGKRIPRSMGTGVAQDKLYISQCKLCGWGIFKPQRPVWSTSPIGWVHAAGDCRG